MPEYPKCKEIREYIERRILDPNEVPYEAADCVNGIFRDFLAILDRKSPLEQACEEVKHGRPLKNLLKVMKEQRKPSLLVARRHRKKIL